MIKTTAVSGGFVLFENTSETPALRSFPTLEHIV